MYKHEHYTRRFVSTLQVCIRVSIKVKRSGRHVRLCYVILHVHLPFHVCLPPRFSSVVSLPAERAFRESSEGLSRSVGDEASSTTELRRASFVVELSLLS